MSLLLAAQLAAALAAVLATPDDDPKEQSPVDCVTELRVKSCMGSTKADVRVELELADGERFSDLSDADGLVRFEICSSDIQDVWVYLAEDSPPVSSTPRFEEDADRPGRANSDLIVC